MSDSAVHPLLVELRARADVAGKSQTDLASAAETSCKNVSRWLNGVAQPRLENLDRMAQAVGARLVLTGHPADEPAAGHLRDLTTAIRRFGRGEDGGTELARITARCEQYLQILDGVE